MPEPIVVTPEGGNGEGQEKLKQLEELVATLQGTVNSTVNELKDVRKAKTDAEAARDVAEAKLKELNGGGNQPTQIAEEAVKKALEARDQQAALSNRQKAEQRFKNTHKEFHPDNDPGGLKYKAVEEKLSRFSTNGLTSEEDFYKVYEDAFVLVNPNKKPDGGQQFNPYAATTSQPNSTTRVTTDDGLTFDEGALINRMGWTKEQYLKVKTKRPGYVEGLLKYYK